MNFTKITIAAVATAFAGIAILAVPQIQRAILFHPTHNAATHGLTLWEGNGFAREVAQPQVVWLMTHGNAGQAADRVYALSNFSPRDSVFFLEYPGFGQRPGKPTMDSMNDAARVAYWQLRARFPKTPVCVVGESIGSGPAAALAWEANPPDKIVLIVPFDTLANIVHDRFHLKLDFLLHDPWDNIAALKNYHGRIELFAAKNDSVIGFTRAIALAKAVGGTLYPINGDHNDWADPTKVQIRYP